MSKEERFSQLLKESAGDWMSYEGGISRFLEDLVADQLTEAGYEFTQSTTDSPDFRLKGEETFHGDGAFDVKSTKQELNKAFNFSIALGSKEQITGLKKSGEDRDVTLPVDREEFKEMFMYYGFLFVSYEAKPKDKKLKITEIQYLKNELFDVIGGKSVQLQLKTSISRKTAPSKGSKLIIRK